MTSADTTETTGVARDAVMPRSFAHDLPARLARAELQSYVNIWERTTPGGSVTILDEPE